MKTASCDDARLYAAGGMYDSERPYDAANAAPLGRWMANVYAPYGYDRPLPKHVISTDPNTEGALLERYRALNATFTQAASTDLFELQNAILYDASLYAVVPPGELVCVYETNRGIDRPLRRDLDASLLGNARRARNADVSYVYFGSVGSANYAHWLVDDLTRAKAIVEHHAAIAPVSIVLETYGGRIDEIRAASIRAVTAPVDVQITFVDRQAPYYFDRLHYVSPSSHTPLLKPPEGLAFLRERLRGSAKTGAPARLFVGRKAAWRNLLNADEVAAFFSDLYFWTVTIDDGSTTLAEQVRLFSNAEIVVGVAGASMANTIFSPPSVRLFYLAGEGFTDPWYWDLAAAKGQEYSVCFGVPWKPQRPSFSSFTADMASLRRLAACF